LIQRETIVYTKNRLLARTRLLGDASRRGSATNAGQMLTLVMPRAIKACGSEIFLMAEHTRVATTMITLIVCAFVLIRAAIRGLKHVRMRSENWTTYVESRTPTPATSPLVGIGHRFLTGM
jgi:hypothetical protein